MPTTFNTYEGRTLDLPQLKIRHALACLYEASLYSEDLQRSAWDFAVEIDALRRVDINNSDLRWLVCKGFVEHASEITSQDEDTRSFRRTGRLIFDHRSSFVLTPVGRIYAQQYLFLLQSESHAEIKKEPAVVKALRMGAIPCWDRDRKELSHQNRLIKKYKVPAPNQEIILAAFEEEQWPPRIDDPLPPPPDQDTKRRLHDTINSLNRHHRSCVIRFSGDGDGEGVCWGFVAQAAG